MEADVALAVLPLSSFRIGSPDPEQGLAVAPAGNIGVVVFELESQKAQQLAVKLLRAREIADAQNQMIDADDGSHKTPPINSWRGAEHWRQILPHFPPLALTYVPAQNSAHSSGPSAFALPARQQTRE